MADLPFPTALFTTEFKSKPILERFSVAIPTLGRPMLETCLHALLAGSVWPHSILLIDQGDNPQVATWADQIGSLGLTVQHIRRPKRGVAAARNQCLAHATTDFLVSIDDDCIPDKVWLEKMSNLLMDHPTGIVTGQVVAVEGGFDVSTITTTEIVTHHKPDLKADVLYAGNMGFALASARKIGPFDESDIFRHAAEDNDWAYRALRNGIPIIYTPHAKVTHLDWRSEEQIKAVFRHYSRGQGGMYGKYIRQGDRFMAYRALRDQLRGPLRWVLGTLRRDRDAVISGRALTLNLLPGILAGLSSGPAIVGLTGEMRDE